MDEANIKLQKAAHISQSNFESILSAKNDWESCVDPHEHQAIFILDDELRVIRANRSVELWGWCDVKEISGIHILNLIRANIDIEHSAIFAEIDEWFLLDTQENIEWICNDSKKGKTYRFSFCLNKDIDNVYHDNNFYAAMQITDLSNQKIINSIENNKIDNHSSDEEDDADLIRLSAYRLHQLANRLIHSEETERKRISSELHDSVGQILAALKYQVESAVLESKKSSQLRKNDVVLEDILKNVTFALSELRRISVDLRPSILEELGLLMTLKWFSIEYNKVYTNLNVDLQLDISESDISDKNKTTMYRIIQESMNNVAKHSNAKNIYIHLSKTDDGILLKVSDDGSGFNIKKIKASKGRGLGLDSMEERAIKSNAKFEMTSSEKSGTEVKVFWTND